MIELIGTNAGLVWNALNEGGKMSVKAVKKATKIKAEKDMYAVENDDIVRIAGFGPQPFYGINSEKIPRSKQIEINKKHFQNISGALRKR